MKENKIEDMLLLPSFFLSELDSMIRFAFRTGDVYFFNKINNIIINGETNKNNIPVEFFVKLYENNQILNYFAIIGDEKLIDDILNCNYFNFSDEQYFFAMKLSLDKENTVFNNILNHLFNLKIKENKLNDFTEIVIELFKENKNLVYLLKTDNRYNKDYNEFISIFKNKSLEDSNQTPKEVIISSLINNKSFKEKIKNLNYLYLIDKSSFFKMVILNYSNLDKNFYLNLKLNKLNYDFMNKVYVSIYEEFNKNKKYTFNQVLNYLDLLEKYKLFITINKNKITPDKNKKDYLNEKYFLNLNNSVNLSFDKYEILNLVFKEDTKKHLLSVFKKDFFSDENYNSFYKKINDNYSSNTNYKKEIKKIILKQILNPDNLYFNNFNEDSKNLYYILTQFEEKYNILSHDYLINKNIKFNDLIPIVNKFKINKVKKEIHVNEAEEKINKVKSFFKKIF